MEIYEYKLPLNTIKVWREEILSNTKFEFIGWTGDSREPYRHWAAYPDISEFYNTVFNCLHVDFNLEGLDLVLDRIIVNTYNHGDSSWIHSDGKTGYTSVLFLNEYWNPNWGGDFSIFSEQNEIIYSTLPTPGKFILFPSSERHAARPVSREAEFPRLAVAFQCTERSKKQNL